MGGAAAHVVAVVAAAVVVRDQPGVDGGLELAAAGEAPAVERGTPAFLEDGAWKRSTTALWFGERGGIRL